ncbi:helix-turn-helix domain-containing protein [Adonisia turfae]|nr:helix-turn-helix transcriptional regulator [Adonisia turfae]
MKTPAYQQMSAIPTLLEDDCSIDARVGNRVRRMRRKANLTQEQLGARVHLSRSQIIAVEKGERGLYARELVTWAKILKCSFNDFLV